MSNIPLVVIIVPLYNTEQYIEECLNSIKNQTYKNFICLVINDGSIDNSLKIANKFSKSDELSRFIIFDKKNEGTSLTRNFGLEIIKKLNISPKYIAFIDSDDAIYPLFLERAISAIEINNVDMSCCGVEEWFKEGCIQHGEKPSNSKIILTHEEIINHCLSVDPFNHRDFCSFLPLGNKIFKYNKIKDFVFDKKYVTGQDQYYFYTIFKNLSSAVIIPHMLFKYRIRASSAVHKLSKEQQFSNMKRDAEMYIYFMQNSPDITLQQAMAKKLFLFLYNSMLKCFQNNQESDAEWYYIELKKLNNSHYKENYPHSLKSNIFIMKLGWKITKIYLALRAISKKHRSKNKQQRNQKFTFFD